MKQLVFFVLVLLSIANTGCEDTDIGMAIDAGSDAVKAVTLSDEEVQRMAAAVSAQADQQHTIAPPDSVYARRMQRLAGTRPEWMGHTFNVKVYLSPQVNAFAMADGSIRFYSGLMDLMDDRELLFVLGHEMGHVIEEHIKEKIRLAYASSAVRKALASQRNEAGDIARSVIGALAQNLLGAQFSQQEERQSDDYGLLYVVQRGGNRQHAVSALHKLASLGSGHSFLSSHPAPESRADRLPLTPPNLAPGEKPSFFEQAVAWLKGLWPFGDKG